jgi:hypothetical protein
MGFRKPMKVLVFADSNWSVGRVHNDVEKYLIDIEFTYIDWVGFDWGYLTRKFSECDVCLTNIVCINFIRQSGILFDFTKCLFMSHGYPDNKGTNIDDLTDEWVYGITSESIRCLFPENRTIFLMPNGVEPSHFHYTERSGLLNTIGWCGSQDIKSKQPQWAHEISNNVSIPISFASALSFSEVCNWYSTIDMLLVTSMPEKSSETGPLPAFESIVSGVLVIGTPVGNFKNVPGPKFNSVEEAIQIIEDLKSNPAKVRHIAREQYEYVMEHCTYSSFAWKWQEALEYVNLRSKRIQ